MSDLQQIDLERRPGGVERNWGSGRSLNKERRPRGVEMSPGSVVAPKINYK